MCYKHDVSLCTYRKECVNTSIKTLVCHVHQNKSRNKEDVTASMQSKKITGGGNGYRTAKHNQLYSKALNRLTVAVNTVSTRSIVYVPVSTTSETACFLGMKRYIKVKWDFRGR
jgi:hypothetical protein